MWLRGVSKEIAPSAELRKQYSHDTSKWEIFRERYLRELMANPAVGRLRELSEPRTVTPVFAARDAEWSSARELRDFLLQRADKAVL